MEFSSLLSPPNVRLLPPTGRCAPCLTPLGSRQNLALGVVVERTPEIPARGCEDRPKGLRQGPLDAVHGKAVLGQTGRVVSSAAPCRWKMVRTEP